MSSPSTASPKVQKIAALIFIGIILCDLIPIIFAFRHLDRIFLEHQTTMDVIGVLFVSFLYVAYSVRNPDIRRHLWDLSWLRILTIILAMTASLVEEVYFRKVLMDWLQNSNVGILWQILISGIAFGLFHAIWGIGGGWQVVKGAVTATTGLGLALAFLYILSGREVIVPIEAHFLVDLILEPALVIFAVEAGMRRRGIKPKAIPGI